MFYLKMVTYTLFLHAAFAAGSVGDDGCFQDKFNPIGNYERVVIEGTNTLSEGGLILDMIRNGEVTSI